MSISATTTTSVTVEDKEKSQNASRNFDDKEQEQPPNVSRSFDDNRPQKVSLTNHRQPRARSRRPKAKPVAMDQEHVPGMPPAHAALHATLTAAAQLYGVLLAATMCSCVNGYVNGVMGGLNDYTQFRDYFAFPEGGAPYTGIVYSIENIGGVVGSFIAGPAASWRGTPLSAIPGALNVKRETRTILIVSVSV